MGKSTYAGLNRYYCEWR